MKTLVVAFMLSLSLSALAEGTFDCHLKTGRRTPNYHPEVAGTLVVTHENIVFSTATESTIFSTESREVQTWRGKAWIEYAINQNGITTTLATDTEETMAQVTIESMRGQTLVDVNPYVCFQTH